MKFRKIYRSQFLRLGLGLFLLSISLFVQGQPVGNEWINPNQTYFKIPTAQDGLYRITYQQLQAAGVPVNSIDPRKFQIFHRGTEHAIQVVGEQDGRLDPSDVIYFFGKRNDGALDTELYKNPADHPHTRYNLYSDTTAYFLTWRLDAGNGKRMVRDAVANTSGAPQQLYAWADVGQTIIDTFYAGISYTMGNVTGIFMSWMDQGQGFMGAQIARNAGRNYTLSGITNTYTQGPNPRLEVVVIGRNRGPHQTEILVGPNASSLRLVGTTTFNDHASSKLNLELNWSDISENGTLIVRVFSRGVVGFNTDLVCPGYFLLQYPKAAAQTPGGQVVTQASSNERTFLRIPSTETLVEAYDRTVEDNARILHKVISGANQDLIIRQSQSARKIWAVRSTQVFNTTLVKVNFRNFNPANHNYYIVSHPLLRRPSGQYTDPVRSYAAYRASTQGGRYDTLVMNMTDIYDQFNYGEKSALALYHFTRHIYSGGRSPNMFLIGKGLNIRFQAYRTPSLANLDLVPTGGTPASDNIFSLGFGPNPFVPAVPTGRLNAVNPNHVAAYLDKVKEMEAKPFDDLSRKKILHLSGGANALELSAFRAFLDSFKAVAESLFLGGNVSTLGKRTTNTVELINVSQEVNEGLGLITFFGHSAADVADIDIGFVSRDEFGYRNKGKYPIILVNGCDAGNIFTTTSTFGEDWVVTADRGALGFIANSFIGITGQLRRFTEFFYTTGYGDNTYINRNLGAVLTESYRKQMVGRTENVAEIAHVQQTVLQGDPVLHLFAANKPDFAISSSDVFVNAFDGRNVRIELDSFRLGFGVKNFGLATTDSLEVKVTRTLPDNRVIQYPVKRYHPSVFFNDTLYITLKKEEFETAGANRVDIMLDPANKIAELNENNNLASFQFNINISGTQNLFPGNFSIISQANVILKSAANDLREGERDFALEMDTTRFFNSPIVRRTTIKGNGLAQWQHDLAQWFNIPDTTVVYWRSKFSQARPNEDTAWTLSSFTLIRNSTKGWAQAHRMQFEENGVFGLEPQYAQNRWEFKSSRNNLAVRTYGASHPEKVFTDVELIFNGTQYIINTGYGLCRNNSLNALAFDQASAVPYRVLSYNQFEVNDPASCGRVPQVINNMVHADIIGNRRILETYINNLKAGDYVLLYSTGTVQYSNWLESTRQAVTSIGLDPAIFSSLSNGDPIIIFGQKGAAVGSAVVVRAPTGTIANRQELYLEQEVLGRFGSGRFVTENIGPSTQWASVKRHIQFSNADQKAIFNVYGITPNDREFLLFQNVPESQISLAGVSPVQYPNIRLELVLEEEKTYKAPQLKNWLVLFSELPEGALFSDLLPTGTEIQQGAIFNPGFKFINSSGGNFIDSLEVRWVVTNRESNFSLQGTKKIPAPGPGLIASFTISVSSVNLVGTNDLRISVNDGILPEQNYANNVIEFEQFFRVLPDRVSPVVDVAFDGAYIMDGDLVSSSPLISIELRDDNLLVAKTDTLGMEISLKFPCESCPFQRIAFSDPRVRWFPSEGQKPFRVEFNPTLTDDGLYTLRVQASDAAGNLAGLEPFTIHFEVSNKSEITNFYPYPNPFSTSTRFVFTLGGSEIPEDIRIQIMTISGKVVREIGMDEIGPIRIGNNQTEFAWDGSDEYGDRLANGVYFYRVIVRKAGAQMDLRPSAGDRGFKNGFGKLYILR
jgi:hypothetical protein